VTTFGNVFKTSSTTGYISVGETVSGGAGFPTGATVTGQTAGTTGGAGTYTMSAVGTAYTASAASVTTFGDVLNITAVTSGSIAVGNPVTGSGVPADALVDSQISGTSNGIGLYRLTVADTAYLSSTTITSVAGVVTAWKAKTVGAVGELIKISTWG
jgi:hypothetical protein